ncbi:MULTISPECIES: hypothetical protein [Priestia]|uniref:hypothetical protein n=1 Tax=Priestia TaxID=2800373 RepID=UPI000301C1E4|nr:MULTISPECIES: hypothetical protein [Priestia]MBG9929463.1 hypothetical protein [Priestia aryabhattai]
MGKKVSTILSKLLVMFMLGITTLVSAQAAYAESDTSSQAEIELIRVLKFTVSSDQLNDELIKMYESDDWEYDGSAFVKKVKYQDDKLKVDGEELSPNEQGKYVVDIEGDSIEKTVGVKVDGVNYEDRKINLHKGTVSTIESIIDVNELQNNMGSEASIEEDTVDTDSPDSTDNLGVTSIGQSDGELPSKGDIVACNRFNGYQGNGKYYSNEASAQAVKNFFQSDCDVALANSVQCLRDHGPASLRYCSLVSSSHYGQCSKMKSHSTRYHKHTSFFGPSGK